jgi:hypothetical protein
MPSDVVYRVADFLETSDVRNLAKATGANWITDTIVRRRDLYDAVRAGDVPGIKKKFASPTEAIHGKGLIGLALEIPRKSAFWALLGLGAVHTAADVHTAEELSPPYRRMALRGLLEL